MGSSGSAEPKKGDSAKAADPSSVKGEAAGKTRQRLLDEYQVGEVLGDGAFGVVYACTKRDDKSQFAVKMVDKVETPVNLIKKEADMLQRMDHPNVVKFHKVIYEKCFVCIVMDLYRGGDVVDGMQLHHKTKGKLQAGSIVHVARQMVEAINYLHSNTVVHRDVKGDNFLMDRKDLADQKCHIALSDFGTAKPLKSGERMHDDCGTKLFWAPEFYGRDYGFKVDIWAIGVIMYGLLDGRFPFKDESDVRKKQISLPKTSSSEASALILKMLEKDEAKRVSAAEALRYEWIAAGAAAPVQQPAGPDEPQSLAGQAIREGGANGAIAERRRELVERLEEQQKGKEERSKPKAAERHFWKPSFTVLDRHAGNVAYRFEWLPQARVEEAGILDLGGANMARANSKDEEAPSIVVGKMLEDHGVATVNFGKGEAKSLGELADEVHRGASRLLLDAAEHRKLVRVVDVVLLRLCNETADGSKRFLIEMSEQLPDGRNRTVTRMPGSKKEPEENTKMTVKRILKDSLNMSDCKVAYDLKTKEVFEEEEDSRNFPGMRTVYRKEIVECQVTTTDMDVLQRVGLPGGSEWNYDSHGNIKFFHWLTEDQCATSSVKLRAPEEEEVSGLVQAPVGYTEEALVTYLTSCNVDVSKFGQDHTKTLKEFSAELMKGETSLMQDSSGTVIRVADIVLVRLVNAAGETLVQTEQTFSDGKKSPLNRLPGTKRRPDENQFLTAWRVLRKQLKMDENLVSLDPKHVRISEDEKDSPAFPGVRTVYRKRVITAELAEAPPAGGGDGTSSQPLRQ